MTNENNKQTESSDDVYVIEDTGETLEDYSVEPVEEQPAETAAAGSQPRSVATESHSEEVSALKDQLLRARADFDNFRKRAEREKTDYYKYALSNLVLELIPILDNFERALAAEATNLDDYRQGVEMIYKQFSDVLFKAGLREVESKSTFDPKVHEAVMREESTEVPAHTILDVFQKGYLLNDRLIRPAMVKVSVGGPERSGEEKQD